MATRTPKAAKEKPAPEIYYDFLYERKGEWGKYGMPVSFVDPKTKYTVEGLIYSLKKRPRDKSFKVSVYYSFDSVYLQQPVVVPVEDIFPTKRLVQRTSTMDNEVVEIPAVVADMTPVRDVKPISFQEISNIYSVYKGVNWTIPELAAILERNSSSYEAMKVLPFLGKVSKRICRITNIQEDTYGINTPEPIQDSKSTTFSISSLEKDYSNCKRCSLSDTRIKMGCSIVTGRGNKKDPKVFIIGEAPGTTERDTGIAFNPTAPAGETLFRVMKSAGLDQDTDCYITNSVWCWPPADPENQAKNGKPEDEHISLCNSRLKIELAVLKPRVIVLLGAVAYKAFFGRFLKGPIGSALGWLPNTGDYDVYMMYHPSYIIRQLNFERYPDKKALIKEEYHNRFTEIRKKADERRGIKSN